MTATPSPQPHYHELTDRNVGFVSELEQRQLSQSSVFVCGVGGMGGTALLSLVRAGVGRIAIADPDRFETSNLNRQPLAFVGTVGLEKIEVARQAVLEVNPELAVETYRGDWTGKLDAIVPRFPVIVNAMDDLRSGILLYRKAREHGATVIDAYTSPLPSVTVVRPADPRPEERLGWPTAGRPLETITPADVGRCLAAEVEYVLAHSSSHRHLDLAVAADVLAGRRPRPSFAPVVQIAGNLMALEAIRVLLGRAGGADCRGYFFNPWTGAVEHPRSALTAWLARRYVRRVVRRLSPA